MVGVFNEPSQKQDCRLGSFSGYGVGLHKVSIDSISAQTILKLKLRSPCIILGQFWLCPSSWVSWPCLVSFQYFCYNTINKKYYHQRGHVVIQKCHKRYSWWKWTKAYNRQWHFKPLKLLKREHYQNVWCISNIDRFSSWRVQLCKIHCALQLPPHKAWQNKWIASELIW